MDMLDFIKIKNFSHIKELMVKRIKKNQATDWEKIFSEDISDKGLVPKLHRNLLKHKIRKQSNLKRQNN